MTEYLPGFEHEAHYPHLEGDERRSALSQWFTDPRLARQLWRWANRYHQPESVLEPSAGHGALLRPILEEPFACRRVVAVDLDPRAMPVLETMCGRARGAGMLWSTVCDDFLGYRTHEPVDLVLMNPPYEEGLAEQFVLEGLRLAERVVGIFKSSIQHGVSRYRMLWSTARVVREVRLAGRPSFGQGETGSSAKTDYVVLEIKRLGLGEDMSSERWTLVEHWP